MLEITVEIKDVYGQTKVYPMCEKSKLFAEIAGTKTLTTYNIQKIKALGYEVKIKPQELKI